MTAQCENAAAGTPDVAQQHLQDRRRPDDLNALGVLRPADGVADARRSFPAQTRCKSLRQLREKLFAEHRSAAPPTPACSARSAACSTWKTQRGCCRVGSPRTSASLRFAAAIFAVAAARGVMPSWSGRSLIRSTLRTARSRDRTVSFQRSSRRRSRRGLRYHGIFAEDRGRIGVVQDILVELLVVFQNVVDQTRPGRECQSRPAVAPRCPPSRTCA